MSSTYKMASPFCCEICGTTFESKSGKDTHVKTIHKDPNTYKCELCDFRSSQQVNLKGHIESIHNKKKRKVTNKSRNRILSCSLCPVTFKNANDLKRHKRSLHQGISYYKPSEIVKKRENIQLALNVTKKFTQVL